jgi:polysulfide reductase-like protein
MHWSQAVSYYGRPVIKEPVWKPEVPWYFFTGGLGGASATLALAAGAGGRDLATRRARLVSLAALGVSPALLVSDLGRPERFINMLRVFKPTSPMNMGSWLLTATGVSTGLATAHDALALFPRIGRGSGAAAGLLGLPLSTYTAALLANTAVPVWHEARRELPFVFAGSAAASAGAAAAIVTPPKQARPARRLGVLGVLLGGAALRAMDRRLGELGRPYREGEAGSLRRRSAIASAAGAAMLASSGRRRSAALAGGAMVLAGAVLERQAVFAAGFQSARDPAYTIEPQAERVASAR